MEACRQPGEVKSYLVPAILVTLFCCTAVGIPALIFAAQSDGLLKAGETSRASEAATKAKTWCWIAFASGFVAMAVYALILYSFVFYSRPMPAAPVPVMQGTLSDSEQAPLEPD